MKKGPRVDARIDILDDQIGEPRTCARPRNIGCVHDLGTGTCLKDVRQMRLSAPGGTVNDEPAAGPVGPAVEPRHNFPIARGDEEIIPAEGLSQAEIQGELALSVIHDSPRPSSRK